MDAGYYWVRHKREKYKNYPPFIVEVIRYASVSQCDILACGSEEIIDPDAITFIAPVKALDSEESSC